ncbi:MAG: TonB-dependent receptor [Candidatus Acidiferrales bacterium]
MKLHHLLRGIFFAALLLAMFAALDSTARGQTNASLRGTVIDQSGGIVVGAQITLLNVGTGIARKTTSGNDGSYLFDLVQVGKYKVTVEKSGFTTFVREGVSLELNQNGRLDVSLRVGQATEVVEVNANVAQVDTTSAVLGKVEDQRMINDLPLVERDTLQLGKLQAGVFEPDPDDGSGNPFSVSGQRSESLTFMLDGADNTDFLGNNIVVSPNPDAVQEFKILTNNYDAQYGRTSGGIVNQITKSGTNAYHGDGFEFLRNNVLNSRNYFLTPQIPDAPPFKRNEFGGTLGGPIKKDKTFFFLAYQGERRREAQVTPSLSVPDQAERAGNFGELCSAYDGGGNCIDPNGTQLVNPETGNNIPYNNMATAGLVNPEIQNYINKYVPLPLPGASGGLFVGAPPSLTDNDQGVVHIDHNLTTHDTLSFLYIINDERDNLPFYLNKGATSGGDVPVGSGFTDTTRSQVGTLSWTHVFGPTLVNEFRFSVNRVASLASDPTDKTSPADLGFTNINPDDPKGTAPPVIFTNSFNLGPSPQGPTTSADMVYRWADGITWTHGKHEWKFGGDFSHVRDNFNYDYFNNGSFDFTYGDFTGNELADFIGGFWDNYYQFSNAIYGIRTNSYSLYGQDTWKVIPRLTLTLGLRYEYYSPQSDNHNNLLGYFPGQQSTVFPDSPPDILYPGDPGTPNKALMYPDRNNFAPRLGFAWDMLGNAKLVMRGGFGIFYDLQDGATNLQFGGEPPFGGVANMYPNSFAGFSGDTMADPFLTYFGDSSANPFPFASRGLVGTFLTPKIPYAYLTDPHFRTPYSYNLNYGFQWQVTRDTMIEAVYVGSFGRSLISNVETNFPEPSVMQEQLSQFGFVYPDCARPLAACVGGSTPFDPNGTPTGALQLYSNVSNGYSNSNQFQLTVDKRFSRHFALRGAYTVAKTTDITSGYRSRSYEYTDPLDPNLDRGLADFDTPQRLVISGIWELPFDRGIHSDGFLKKLAAGWQANGIATFQKGNPFTLYSNDNSSYQNNYLDRPDIVGPIRYYNPRRSQDFSASNADCLGNDVTGGKFWFNPTAFDCVNVPIFTFGTLSRNVLRGPGINNWDLSIVKNTPLGGESRSLQFRAEFFNAFNHTQFSNPDNQGFSGTFGQVTLTRVDARIIQFGLKLYF